MKTYHNLFAAVCSFDNLELAFQKARVGKSKKPYVVEFESDLKNELFKLQWELMTGTYQPRSLTTFTVRDPKTRKISASHFRDRVVHHALINVIGPIFESRFIHDTYANRIGKGTSAALERFDHFLRKVTGNGRLVPRERETTPAMLIMSSAMRSSWTSKNISRVLTAKYCAPFCASAYPMRKSSVWSKPSSRTTMGRFQAKACHWETGRPNSWLMSIYPNWTSS